MNSVAKTPEAYNVDNPVQAAGAARGKGNSLTGTPKEFNPLRG